MKTRNKILIQYLSYILAAVITVILIVSTGCKGNLPLQGAQNPDPDRDWSKFERPPIDTPCMIRIFFWYGRLVYRADILGKWGDDKPWIMWFPIKEDIFNVIRVEMRYKGETIYAQNFKPPISFKGGTIAGLEKDKLETNETERKM